MRRANHPTFNPDELTTVTLTRKAEMHFLIFTPKHNWSRNDFSLCRSAPLTFLQQTRILQPTPPERLVKASPRCHPDTRILMLSRNLTFVPFFGQHNREIPAC